VHATVEHDMDTTQQEEQRRPRVESAPRVPRSSTWRMELVVAVLGMILGLATALLLLS
jgi:hypothetical protein